MDAIEPLEEQEAFFQSVHNCFLKATASVSPINLHYRICDTSVCLSFAGKELIPHITPALNHLMIPEVQSPDLTICIWDSFSTKTRMVPPPWKRDRYTYRGDIWGYNSNRIKTAFHWFEFSLNIMDIKAQRGLFWVERATCLPSWLNAAPLRTLLHWWLAKNKCQLIHAAAVGTEDGAILLTGKGGIGKSTTALSSLKSAFFYLGDDYIVARIKPQPYVYSLYNTAKLNADHVRNFSDFSIHISNSENLKDEKAVIFLYPAFREQIVNAMPLRAILVPHITSNNRSRVTKISSENVLRAASFTTMTQLPGAGITTYEFLNQLSSRLPCFNLELGSDLSHIPVTISSLLHELSNRTVNSTFGNFTEAQSAAPKAMPVVSIILPVFNGEQFIREAVENVLSQGYPSLEIIVIDDGSTDNTKDIVEQLPVEVRYFRQDNGGPAAARNKGVREATGEFIAFNDVDDLWPKNNLHKLANELLQNEDIEVVHGYAQLALYNNTTREYEYSGNPAESFPYSIGAALYRRSAFTEVGLFDPTLLYGEDTDWFNRARELNLNVRRLEDVTLIVRRHGGNMTFGKNMVELNSLRVFKKSLDRMRARKRDVHVHP